MADCDYKEKYGEWRGIQKGPHNNGVGAYEWAKMPIRSIRQLAIWNLFISSSVTEVTNLSYMIPSTYIPLVLLATICTISSLSLSDHIRRSTALLKLRGCEQLDIGTRLPNIKWYGWSSIKSIMETLFVSTSDEKERAMVLLKRFIDPRSIRWSAFVEWHWGRVSMAMMVRW